MTNWCDRPMPSSSRPPTRALAVRACGGEHRRVPRVGRDDRRAEVDARHLPTQRPDHREGVGPEDLRQPERREALLRRLGRRLEDAVDRPVPRHVPREDPDAHAAHPSDTDRRERRTGSLRERAARSRDHGWVLQVRELSVEVGGSLILEGASFSIRARDKVGLVGRNGAGKTSLLKVLGGAADPAAGLVDRVGGLGYLPQDPRLDGVDESHHRPPAHPLRPRVRRGARAHREAPPPDGGGPERAGRGPLQQGRGAVPPRRRVLRGERGPPHRRRPRAATRSSCGSRWARSPVARSAAWRSPASSSPAATSSSSTSRPTTSTATPRSGSSASCGATAAPSS